MSVDLNLPTFGLDCRDWLVATEADGLLIDDSEEVPVVAILSTAVIRGAELTSARAVLSLALIGNDQSVGTPESVPEGSEYRETGAGEAAGAPGPAIRSENASTAEAIHGVNATHTENWSGQDICVLDADWSAGYARFAVPVPGGDLAIVAEFTSEPDPSQELVDRFYDLVTSFRWAA